MKTTIDIADALFAQAKAEAERRGTTLRSLVEDGLRQLLSQRTDDDPFVLRDLSVGGGGVRPEYLAGGHDAFLDAAYGSDR